MLVKTARGTIYVAAQNIAQFVINLVFLMILARILTKADIGSISALSFAIVIFTAVADLSLCPASTKYISEHIGRGELEQAASVAVTIRRYVLLSSSVALVVAVAFSSWFSTLLWGTPAGTVTFILAFLDAFVYMLRLLYMSYLRGLQLFSRYSIVVVTAIAVGRVLGVILAFLGYGVAGVMLGWLIGELSGFSLAFFFNLGQLPKPKSLYPSKTLFNFGLPLLFETAVSNFTDWSDQMLFLAITGNLMLLGVYFLAVRGAATISVIYLAFNVTVLPLLSEIYGREERNQLTTALKHVTRYLAYLIFPAAFGMMAISETVITVFFGRDYAAGSLPLSILAVGAILAGFNYVFIASLSAIAETRVFIKIALAATVADVVLVTLLTPILGILGPTIARVGMWATNFVFMYSALNRRVKVEFDRGAIWRALVSSLVMAFCVYWFERQLKSGLGGHVFLNLGLEMIAGFVIYSLVLLLLRGLNRQDFTLLRRILPAQLYGFIDFLERRFT
ncbi:MAG: polysaccharide biosynthesis C-terminal domain-containing protein [Candidatus Bathyarchaeia archaeon]